MPTFRREPGRPRKNEPRAPSRSVDVRIPEDILEALIAIAERRGISKHHLIREALAEYVERHERPADRATTDRKGEEEAK